MANSLKFPHHKLNTSQYDEFETGKKFKRKSKNLNKNKGRNIKNVHSSVISVVTNPSMVCEQPYFSTPVHITENPPYENCLPLSNNTKALDEQTRKDSTNIEYTWDKKVLLDDKYLIEINLPPNLNFPDRFHRVIKIDELGKIMIKIIYPDKPATYIAMDIKNDNINQSNISEVEQLPTLIPDYIVINIPGMDFPVLACSDACGKSAMISMASYSICPDYAVRSESIKTSTSNLPTPTFHTSHLSVQSINSTGNNDNTNCDYEKNYVMQDWISNSLINSDDKTSFGRRLSIDTSSNIDHPCQFRDHVPDEKINTSTSNCLLDATTSTLEIKSKEKSTTACLLNDNMQEISFDDNGSIKLPPHGSYHVNKFNNNSMFVENCTNMFQLSDSEIVSSFELDLTPETLMVKLPTGHNKQFKGHSKANVPNIITKSLPTKFIDEEEEYAEDGSELPRSPLSSPHSTISSTSFSMSVFSTSSYAESMNTVISAYSTHTVDKMSHSSSCSGSSSLSQSPEFRANSVNDDHIADHYIEEITYYLPERSMSPEHLSPVIEEDETLISIQNSQLFDCSTLNEYEQLGYSEDQHSESFLDSNVHYDDSDFEQSSDECFIKSNLNYEEYCPELDYIFEHLQTLNPENDKAIRLRRQLQIIHEANYPVELPLSNSWIMYYIDISHSKINPRLSSKNKYSSTLHSVFNCSTVPELCEQYKALTSRIKPSELKNDSNLNFFKDYIQPMWEDERNEKGGKLTLCPPRNELDSLWEDIVMLLAGGMIDIDDNICGAICARRNRGDRIEIWISSQATNEDVINIRTRLAEELGSELIKNLRYKKHYEK